MFVKFVWRGMAVVVVKLARIWDLQDYVLPTSSMIGRHTDTQIVENRDRINGIFKFL